MQCPATTRIAAALLLVCTCCAPVWAKQKPHHKPKPKHVQVKRHWWSRSHFDPTKDDVGDYDDPVVRAAAVDALGLLKGSVVAIDPATGRVLAIVNQKMAFSAGFEPCSTIKLVVALAGLNTGTIRSDTMLRIGSRHYMNLTEALAHSNNKFFETLGGQLGFKTVIEYAQMVGFGELAGMDIPEEQAGTLPPKPPFFGGVERMCSFGSGIRVTPLEMASLVATFANNGTMYWLQYPRTDDDVHYFAPWVKKELPIAPPLADLRDGMVAAVLYGTAQRSYEQDIQALGKTGTCNDETDGGGLGWFASYAGQGRPQIVLVVLLRGGQVRVSGPRAAEIAGRVYANLHKQGFFTTDAAGTASKE